MTAIAERSLTVHLFASTASLLYVNHVEDRSSPYIVLSSHKRRLSFCYYTKAHLALLKVFWERFIAIVIPSTLARTQVKRHGFVKGTRFSAAIFYR